MAIGLSTTLPMYRAVTGSTMPFESVGAANAQIFGKPLLDYTPSPLFKTAPPPAPAAPEPTSRQDRQSQDAKVQGAASSLPEPMAPKVASYPPTYTRSTQSQAPVATGTHLNTKA